MTKLSQVVVNHIESLLAPFHTPLKDVIMIYPKETLSTKENQLFWRYHGHFPQEFTQALINQLPVEYKFVSYDHLRNRLKVEHKSN